MRGCSIGAGQVAVWLFGCRGGRLCGFSGGFDTGCAYPAVGAVGQLLDRRGAWARAGLKWFDMRLRGCSTGEGQAAVWLFGCRGGRLCGFSGGFDTGCAYPAVGAVGQLLDWRGVWARAGLKWSDMRLRRFSASAGQAAVWLLDWGGTVVSTRGCAAARPAWGFRRAAAPLFNQRGWWGGRTLQRISRRPSVSVGVSRLPSGRLRRRRQPSPVPAPRSRRDQPRRPARGALIRRGRARPRPTARSPHR